MRDVIEGRKRWGVAVLAATAFTVIGTVVALACTSLASLNLSQASGAPGTQVTVTGSSFSSTSGGYGPVVLHWNAVDGPVLATVTPDSSGAIGPTAITIPTGLEPGYYTIVATQTTPDGHPAFGTPARAAFEVTGNGVGATGANGAGQQPSATSLTSSGSGLGAGMIGLLVALAAGGLVLFGIGATTFIGSYRRVPSVSKVRK